MGNLFSLTALVGSLLGLWITAWNFVVWAKDDLAIYAWSLAWQFVDVCVDALVISVFTLGLFALVNVAVGEFLGDTMHCIEGRGMTCTSWFYSQE